MKITRRNDALVSVFASADDEGDEDAAAVSGADSIGAASVEITTSTPDGGIALVQPSSQTAPSQ